MKSETTDADEILIGRMQWVKLTQGAADDR